MRLYLMYVPYRDNCTDQDDLFCQRMNSPAVCFVNLIKVLIFKLAWETCIITNYLFFLLKCCLRYRCSSIRICFQKKGRKEKKIIKTQYFTFAMLPICIDSKRCFTHTSVYSTWCVHVEAMCFPTFYFLFQHFF